MSAETVSFTARLQTWLIEESNVAFVRIDGEAGEAISAYELTRRLELGRRGFGSVKVHPTIGDSRWSTSVFPTRDGGWFLPVKKAICRAEDLAEGEEVAVTLELI